MRFALDAARRGGWGPWYGAKALHITGFVGIDQTQPWSGTPDDEWDYKNGTASPATGPTLVYDPNHPAHPQEESFDCSQESLEWALWACGRHSSDDWLESEMIRQHVMGRQDGLLDASGAGLARFINDEYRELGFSASNEPSVTFGALAAEAGRYPLLIGGRAWNHWSGVRGYDAARNQLLLANPADGHKGIRQEMTPEQFEALGPFSMVRVMIHGRTTTKGDDEPMYKHLWEGTIGVIAEIGDNVADALEGERAQLDDYGTPPAPPADTAASDLREYATQMQAWAERVQANTNERYAQIGAIGQRLRDIRIQVVGPRP
jgi:hypothetical protein